MNLPNLPTDNLYKFVALSGLVIFLLSVIYPQTEVWDIEIEILRLSGEGKEIDYLLNEIEDDSDELVDIKLLTADEKKALVQNLVDLGLKSIKLETALDEINIRNERIGSLLIKMYVGIALGSAMMCFGFLSWYHRVQKYQDEIIKKEAEQNNA